MPVLPKSWVLALFERFREIYGERFKSAECIDAWDHYHWGTALAWVTGAQIKIALEECRANPEIMITPDLFASFCGEDYQRTDKQATSVTEVSAIVVPKEKPPEPDLSPAEWRHKLLAMDDTTAVLTLSGERQYERSRLLSERTMNDNVMRLRGTVEPHTQPVPVKADLDNTYYRKDWE